MKLVHVVPSLAEQHGGPSKSVIGLTAALSRLGHSIELMTTDPLASVEGDERLLGELRVKTYRRDWPERLCPSRGLRTAILQSEADIIHHHSLWLRTLHYANQTDSRLVISPRGMMSGWAWNHRPWRKQLARWFIHPRALESAQGWHATSTEEEADIRSLGFQQSACIAPNGVDAPIQTEIEDSRRYWESACPEATGRSVALFYSRFHQKKRVLELIDSWLQHAPKDWLLLLAGIPEEFTPQALEDYAFRLSGAGRVRAFTSLGRPPPYAVANLFLLPSHNENFGLVVAEAMAYGVPAIVTDSTPWKELSRRELGWCVPWQEFGTTLAGATAEGPECLKVRGVRARDWVLGNFSWDNSARTLADFYVTVRAGNARHELPRFRPSEATTKHTKYTK